MNSVAIAYGKGFRDSLRFYDADESRSSVDKMRETVSKMSKEIKKAESESSPEVRAWAKDQQKTLSEASKELALISAGDQPVGRLKRLKVKIAEALAKTKEFYKEARMDGTLERATLAFILIQICIQQYGFILTAIGTLLFGALISR